MESIKTTFDAACAGLSVDSKLAKKIAQYQVAFRTRNEDHIEFFGGKLLGNKVVRFLPSDQDRWFEEILQTDEVELTEKIHNLPTVNPDFFVSSNAMNLSCVWLMHALNRSKLPEKEKFEAMVNVALVLQYKYITSIIYHFYPYPADEATAQMAYAQLSKKFLITQYQNWYELLRAMSERLVQRGELHWRAIDKMEHDSDVIKMVNDVQGRLRDMVKNITRVFMEVHKQGVRMHSTSAVVEFDGEEILRDKTRGLVGYTRYIESVVPDKASFIRQELVAVIVQIMPSMNPRLFEQCLEWMSDNYQQRNAGLIEQLLEETLIHSFGYLKANSNLVRNTHDLSGILSRLRGTYMSSRNSDPVLWNLREKAEQVAQLATQNKNANTLAALRTGILLYVCLRTYTMHHYSQALVTG